MSVCVVTGSSGLVGSAAVRRFVAEGYRVVGIDNDMRRRFFGAEASTQPTLQALQADFDEAEFTSYRADIRDDQVGTIFSELADDNIALIVHCAAQPAHDWAATAPLIDFGVNALGTLNLLEVTRTYCPHATFIHCSTSKVYGDNPNQLPLVEYERHLWPEACGRYFNGIDASMSIDHCTHSLFGASKAAADLLVQEYGRYFGLNTVCFRPGCITGAQHAGAELHGFLAYLTKCVRLGRHYRVIGYQGKQVRCNIHADDLVSAFVEFHAHPRPGAVYNIGGGLKSACSVLEAIDLAEGVTGRALDWSYEPVPRIGDHKWWVSDNEPFQFDYPDWHPAHTVCTLLEDIDAHSAVSR